jgi:hypothetical protein
MLRLYFLQQWYGLADEALEDALYDSQALRGFFRRALVSTPFFSSRLFGGSAWEGSGFFACSAPYGAG